MKHLVLVGFMGSGKSTVGRKAALRLRVPFVDTDDLIVQRAGRPIPEIFETEGEAAFRELEAWAIREAVAGPPSVISTGGGALLRPENVDALRENGILVHLEVDPPTVLLRTGSRKNRPLLAGADDPLERIRTLMDARRDVYARADARVNTVGLPMSKVATDVIHVWKGLGGESDAPLNRGTDGRLVDAFPQSDRNRVGAR